MASALNYVKNKSEAFSTKMNAVSEAHMEVDIAVVKATSRDPTPPKEKHVQTLLRVCKPHNLHYQYSHPNSRAGDLSPWLSSPASQVPC